MKRFDEKLVGALVGGAIGDAMGAPAEGGGADTILARYSDWNFTQFIPPWGWNGVDHYRKGNGRITDDTLMVEALMNAYRIASDHLDAYGYAEYLLPRICNDVVWVPEYQKEMPIFERLWVPEKYPRWRLQYNNAEPRTAGVGNMVNCGVAMWIMPVGAVNAGDPSAAYQEAAALGQAHNESFAVEAAAVLAAAFAAAFGADSIGDVIDTAIAMARDGTRRACEATVKAVDGSASLEEFIRAVRAAVAPFDQRTGHTSDDAPLDMTDGGEPSDIGRPSRTKSIEELPVALAALRFGEGDFLKTLRAAVCYGRDCDSIAGMACGLYGALFGSDNFPASLTEALAEANRRDYLAIAQSFTQVARGIHERDIKRFKKRMDVMDGVRETL